MLLYCTLTTLTVPCKLIMMRYSIEKIRKQFISVFINMKIGRALKAWSSQFAKETLSIWSLKLEFSHRFLYGKSQWNSYCVTFCTYTHTYILIKCIDSQTKMHLWYRVFKGQKSFKWLIRHKFPLLRTIPSLIKRLIIQNPNNPSRGTFINDVPF